MAKPTLDQLLDKLEREVDDTSLIESLRDAIDDQAENPNLVRDLRKQRDEAVSERDTLRLENRVAVLKAAGVPENAHKRFLRDWDAEKSKDEFTTDTVKAAADEFGYRLEAGGDGGGGNGDAGGGNSTDDDMARRREAQQRRRDAQALGSTDDTLPPDLDTQIATAEKDGNTELVFALKRQKMQKAAS
jgi:hypothetical protein